MSYVKNLIKQEIKDNPEMETFYRGEKSKLEATAGKIAAEQEDGSLVYLFRNYQDDGTCESLIDFGESVGDEAW